MSEESLQLILAELQKLNLSIAEILCAQKMQAARWKAKENAERASLGQRSIYADMGREGGISGIGIQNGGTS